MDRPILIVFALLAAWLVPRLAQGDLVVPQPRIAAVELNARLLREEVNASRSAIQACVDETNLSRIRIRLRVTPRTDWGRRTTPIRHADIDVSARAHPRERAAERCVQRALRRHLRRSYYLVRRPIRADVRIDLQPTPRVFSRRDVERLVLSERAALWRCVGANGALERPTLRVAALPDRHLVLRGVTGANDARPGAQACMSQVVSRLSLTVGPDMEVVEHVQLSDPPRRFLR